MLLSCVKYYCHQFILSVLIGYRAVMLTCSDNRFSGVYLIIELHFRHHVVNHSLFLTGILCPFITDIHSTFPQIKFPKTSREIPTSYFSVYTVLSKSSFWAFYFLPPFKEASSLCSIYSRIHN